MASRGGTSILNSYRVFMGGCASNDKNIYKNPKYLEQYRYIIKSKNEKIKSHGPFRFRPYSIRIWGAWQELSIKNHDAKQNIGTFRCKQAQNWQAAQRKVLLLCSFSFDLLMLPPTFENKAMAKIVQMRNNIPTVQEGARNKYDDVNETMPAVADKTDRKGL